MFGNDASLLEIDVSEHHAVAGDEPAVEHVGHFLERYFAPAIRGGGIGNAFNVRKKNGLPLRSPF
jgi:hypothetical protein